MQIQQQQFQHQQQQLIQQQLQLQQQKQQQLKQQKQKQTQSDLASTFRLPSWSTSVSSENSQRRRLDGNGDIVSDDVVVTGSTIQVVMILYFHNVIRRNIKRVRTLVKIRHS